MHNVQGVRVLTLAGVISIATMATDASAQTPAAPTTDPNPGAMTLTAIFDVVSTYMFRGIRQNSTGVALWPVANLGLSIYSGDGSLKSVGVNFGTWNSQHTGDTGTDGPTGKLWYESDFYSTLGLGLGHGVSLATTYTAYTSPNNAFTTVKEIAFKVALDDSSYLGEAAPAVWPRGLRVRCRSRPRPGRRRREGRAVPRARRIARLCVAEGVGDRPG
jgi:hypothetical protein